MNFFKDRRPEKMHIERREFIPDDEKTTNKMLLVFPLAMFIVAILVALIIGIANNKQKILSFITGLL
jgi:hypothetical protein